MNADSVWRVIGPILMLGMIGAVVGGAIKLKKPLLLLLLIIPILIGIAATLMHGRPMGN